MRLSIALSLILLRLPAHALPPDEKAMVSSLGNAIGQMITGTQETARAACEAGRTQLTDQSPKYLGAYVEACYAFTAAPLGPGKKPASCAYYQRALQIWKDNPPPKDDDESRISRAKRRKDWRKFAEENCPETAASKAKPVSVPHVPGGIVDTAEGLSFELPDGWSVKSFDEVTGSAFLVGPDDYSMGVSRDGLSGYSEYPDKESLPDGRELQTEYKPFLDKTTNMVLYSRVMLKDECVRIGITRLKAKDVGVEKDRGFAWLRAVASSVKITGPRRCIGDCPPGKVRAKKTAAKK